MEKHQTYFNLLDALKEKGCPICFLIKKKIHKSMENFLYENVNDPETRKKIRESLGYCALHSWQLQKFGDGLGLSIIYEDLLGILKNKIEEFTSKKNKYNLFKKQLNLLTNNIKLSYHEKTKRSCPICKEMRDTEKIYISSFIEYFNDIEFNINYESSFGLCLPHFISTIKLCKNESIIKELCKIEIKKIELLQQELIEFQRKHDYRFSYEGYGKEKDSWIRAIEKLIGKEGIF
jgi:hypothetical protein